jgi:hypothetical protein
LTGALTEDTRLPSKNTFKQRNKAVKKKKGKSSRYLFRTLGLCMKHKDSIRKSSGKDTDISCEISESAQKTREKKYAREKTVFLFSCAYFTKNSIDNNINNIARRPVLFFIQVTDST